MIDQDTVIPANPDEATLFELATWITHQRSPELSNYECQKSVEASDCFEWLSHGVWPVEVSAKVVLNQWNNCCADEGEGQG